MTRRNLPLDQDRLWSDIMTLAAITDPDRPYTRRSFTPRFLEGRAWLAKRFAEAGLDVRLDTAGNLIGRLEGRDPSLPAIAIGSHSDTVPSGGRFDGIAGVATGLEIVRALREAGETLAHPLEVIDFLAEEPSEYGLSCIGSRGMAGALDAAMLAMTEPGGECLADAMRRVGADPGRLAEARRQDLAAFFELHIEQGPVLEAEAIDVGLVTGIVGIRRLEIVFAGEADHAGTAPMTRRHDALVAGARTVIAVREAAERLAAEALAAERPGYVVATIGIAEVEPGGSNVVPGRCRLVVDARATESARLDRLIAAIDQASQAAAEEADVARSLFATLSNAAPVACDDGLRDALRQGAATLGMSAIDLASGAGHDAAYMARLCPSAMVFVACRGGKSHAPEEWAEPDAIAGGAAVILEAVKRIDRAGASPA